MSISVSIICMSLLYSILVTIVYFSNKKVNSIETKLYNTLVKINVVGLIIELLCCYFVYYHGISNTYELINIFFNKLFLVYLLLWLVIFNSYIFFISFYLQKSNEEKIKINKNKIFTIIGIIFIIMFLLILLLPTYYYNEKPYVYSYGPATNAVLIFGTLSIFFDFFCLFKNWKNIKTKKYYPLFIFTLLMIFAAIIRVVNPGLTIVNSCFAFITVLMFFTIENPDFKVIKELRNLKETAERSNNNKSTFIFNIVQKLRTPINNFKRIGNEIQKENDIKTVKEGVNILVDEANNLELLVNDILDISSLDIKNLKIFKNKYNINLLFKEIITKFNTNCKEKEIDFRVNIENDLPKHIYGDSIRLKQIINTLLYNSLKYTKKGFIELRVTSVIKYDVIRIIIVVEDSGEGMNLEKSNKVFYDYGQDIDIDKINEEDMNLPIVKKLVDIVDGNIMLKSTEGKGTEIILILDQKIEEEEENDNTLIQNYQKEKKILVIDDNNKKFNQLTKLLKADNIIFELALGGQKGLESIRKGNSYDFILINSELEKLSSIDTLQKLKVEEKIKTPIIVMTDKKDGSKYISLGFNEYIEEPFIKDKILKIIK